MSERSTSSHVRSLGFARLAAFLLGAASVALSATVASAADGVTLRVEKGPGAGSITLNWTGGQPGFDIYRAPSLPGVAPMK